MKPGGRWIAGALLLAGRAAAGAGCPDPSDYATVLQATVRGGGVDYPLLHARYLPALEAYLTRAAACDPAALSRADRLALYINLYNAVVLHAAALRDAPGYTVSGGSFELFDEPLVSIGGRTVSLNQLEREMIRREFADPRVHAALVCAARSCPALLSRPYRGADLEQTLDERMRRFLSDPTRNRIDLTHHRLELSRIFEWYAADFGGPERLADYVDRFVDGHVRGFAVSFLDYSWELNRADNPENPDRPPV